MRSIAIACSVHSDWQDCTKRAMEPPPKFGDGGGAIEVQSGSLPLLRLRQRRRLRTTRRHYYSERTRRRALRSTSTASGRSSQ